MKNKLCLTLLFICIGLVAGCVGTPFRWDTARKIQLGMTKAQVVEIMGKPYLRTAAGQVETWTWSYGTGLGTGGAYKIAFQAEVVTEIPKIPVDL